MLGREAVPWEDDSKLAVLTSAFLDAVADGQRVAARHLEDVMKPVQHHLNHLSVLYVQQAAERGNHALLHHVRHLVGRYTITFNFR